MPTLGCKDSETREISLPCGIRPRGKALKASRLISALDPEERDGFFDADDDDNDDDDLDDSADDTDDLVWSRNELLPEVTAWIAIELDTGRVEHVTVTRVLQRGKVFMVLGERIRDGSAFAYPLSRIRGVAKIAKARWTPSPGSNAPAGHVPCPCGSGARYRQCCRASLPS